MSTNRNTQAATKNAKRRRTNRRGPMPGTVTVPAAQYRVSKQRAPRYKNVPDGMSISHSELLNVYTAQPGFSLNGATINPGLSNAFPWLSGMANQFETYAFTSLVYEFRTRSGYGKDGSVLMYIDTDVKDAPPASYEQAATMAGNVSGPPYSSLFCRANPRALKRGMDRLYTRSGAFTGDQSLYDVGTFYIVSQNPFPDPSLYGEVWIHYTCVLRTPQTPASGGAALKPGQVTFYQDATSRSIAREIKNAMFRGGLEPALDEAGLGSTTTSGRVAMKAGRWLIDQIVDGSYGFASGLSLSSFISPNGIPASTSNASSVDDIAGPWETQTSNSYIVEFEDEGELDLDVQIDPEDATQNVGTLRDVSCKLTYLGPPGISALSTEERKARITKRDERADKIRREHAARAVRRRRRIRQREHSKEDDDTEMTTAGDCCSTICGKCNRP